MNNKSFDGSAILKSEEKLKETVKLFLLSVEGNSWDDELYVELKNAGSEIVEDTNKKLEKINLKSYTQRAESFLSVSLSELKDETSAAVFEADALLGEAL